MDGNRTRRESVPREFIEPILEIHGCQLDPTKGGEIDADRRIWWLLKGDQVVGAVALPRDVPRRLIFEISGKGDIPPSDLFNADQRMSDGPSDEEATTTAS